MKLVDDWRDGLKWVSTHMFLAIAELPVIWVAMPQEWRDSVPPTVLIWVTASFAIIGLIGRFLQIGTSSKQ